MPTNVRNDLDRASAVIILNELESGRAFAVLEGALISAKRTAASAALAVSYCHGRTVDRIALIGCGPINFEILRFLSVGNSLRVSLHDIEPGRAAAMKDRIEREFVDVHVVVCETLADTVQDCDVIAFGTTAATPHVHDRRLFARGSTVLHVSLRDLSPEIILACDNVVDDPEHVCRARTSLDLASSSSGNRDFIRTTIGDILIGNTPGRNSAQDVIIFSPFGLGILDVAVADWVYRRAAEQGFGIKINFFD